MKKQEQDNLIQTLQTRFEQNLNRHPDIPWADVQTRLEHHPNALKSLQAMEVSGGEPDVIGFDPKTGAVTFCDCAKESPTGRRSLCYDRAALDARKENKPKGSAIEMAEEMGIALLTEDQYRALQTLGEFDAKTSSWLATPPELRSLDGAIFGDYRYGRVFIYHNGVQSYYAARGFRGVLQV
ncbi:DUF4256 domain-containing protein [Pseudomonas beijingensis]|uniref:DUF4256 domain-containing protein n=1 Tax=Pseudomonas beijingensis TaxID=2954101 RepID=A0ABY9FIB1_9PSED|nr:DUF4256 domain-containing protein [Pseudomonas sp. FP2034]WLH02185.1 DUF4256 domain-containing protein [Pseudomonas sp. FP2034]